MWSITVDVEKARRMVWQAREDAARRLSDAVVAEAERIVAERRRWWSRPLFAKPVTVERVADVLRVMVHDPDRNARDVCARGLGLDRAWEWHRRSALMDLAGTVRYLDRMWNMVLQDGVTSMTLTGSDAALFSRVFGGEA